MVTLVLIVDIALKYCWLFSQIYSITCFPVRNRQQERNLPVSFCFWTIAGVASHLNTHTTSWVQTQDNEEGKKPKTTSSATAPSRMLTSICFILLKTSILFVDRLCFYEQQLLATHITFICYECCELKCDLVWDRGTARKLLYISSNIFLGTTNSHQESGSWNPNSAVCYCGYIWKGLFMHFCSTSFLFAGKRRYIC